MSPCALEQPARRALAERRHPCEGGAHVGRLSNAWPEHVVTEQPVDPQLLNARRGTQPLRHRHEHAVPRASRRTGRTRSAFGLGRGPRLSSFATDLLVVQERRETSNERVQPNVGVAVALRWRRIARRPLQQKGAAVARAPSERERAHVVEDSEPAAMIDNEFIGVSTQRAADNTARISTGWWP